MDLIKWFSGGAQQYMDTFHCMQQDTLWITITIVLHLAVFVGYLLIALHWFKSQKSLPSGQAKLSLSRMVMIFLFCGNECLMTVLRMYWPAWRLTDIFTAILLFYVYKYLYAAQGLVTVYSQLGQAQKLQIDLNSFIAMSDNLPIIIWATDQTGSIKYVNKRWEDYTGLSLDQTQKIGWKTLIYPEDMPKCLDMWTDSLASGDLYEVEYRLKAKDGTWKWFIARAVPLRGGDGKIERWYGSCTEIEDQKALSLKLLKENDSLMRLKQLTEQMTKQSAKRTPKRKPDKGIS